MCPFGRRTKLEHAASSRVGPCLCRRAWRAGLPAGKPSTQSARGKAAIAYFPFPSRSATRI
jgi:hypothetical protein